MTHDLLGIPATYLPPDPAADASPDTDSAIVAAAHPASSLAWAVLAEDALAQVGRTVGGRPMPMLAPATTGAWTLCDALGGGAKGPSRGSTCPIAASCGPWLPCRGRRMPSVRSRRSAAVPSCCGPRRVRVPASSACEVRPPGRVRRARSGLQGEPSATPIEGRRRKRGPICRTGPSKSPLPGPAPKRYVTPGASPATPARR